MPSATIDMTELIGHYGVKRFVRGDSLPSEEREKTFAVMVSVALGALAR